MRKKSYTFESGGMFEQVGWHESRDIHKQNTEASANFTVVFDVIYLLGCLFYVKWFL